MSSHSELLAFGEKGTRGLAAPELLRCFGQQSGPSGGTQFVGYMQKTKGTFSTLLFHQKSKRPRPGENMTLLGEKHPPSKENEHILQLKAEKIVIRSLSSPPDKNMN